MTDQVTSMIFGLLGGSMPGVVHVALKVRRKNHSAGATLDLTYRAQPRKPKK